MRISHFSLVFLPIFLLRSPLGAQGSGIQFQAGLGYARLFDGGGLSLTAAVNRSLSTPAKNVQHGIGGSLWYARTDLASAPNDGEERHLVGVGLRYQLGIGTCCRAVSLFLALPVQLLRSSIPDRARLVAASLAGHGIPEPPPEPPVEDQVGAAWGWGAGLEVGLRVGLTEQLSAQTSVQGLYQDIYASSSRNGAWTWHAGFTYQLASR
jgi:hypothetical protein